VVLEPEKRIASVEELIEGVMRLLKPDGGDGLGPGPSVPDPSPTPDVGARPVTEAAIVLPPSAIGEAFSRTVHDLAANKLQHVKLEFDSVRRRYSDAWERLRPPIEDNPAAAPAAAKQMIESVGDICGRVLAMSRTDSDELFDDFKALLEAMLKV